MSIRKSGLTAFLRSYAVALSNGDLKGISSAWHMSSLGSTRKARLSKARQLEGFLQTSGSGDHESGIAAARLEALEVSKLSGNIVTAKVTGRQVCSDGKKGVADRSFYVISRRERSGRLGINLASQVGGA